VVVGGETGTDIHSAGRQRQTTGQQQAASSKGVQHVPVPSQGNYRHGLDMASGRPSDLPQWIAYLWQYSVLRVAVCLEACRETYSASASREVTSHLRSLQTSRTSEQNVAKLGRERVVGRFVV
jgi:hypothetical protein